MPDEQTPFSEYSCSLGTVIAHEAGSYHICTDDGRVIGVLANGELSPANVEADIASPAAPIPPVPDEVTPLQMRRALNAAGLRSTVEAAVAAADQETKDAWEFASTIRRDNALLAGMAVALGLTGAQVDDLFRAAAALEL
jgi:hypothetical protein